LPEASTVGFDVKCDVAIIGGGPAGATVAGLLRKYNPSLSVAIFEKESFPRDHVGESQLPGVSAVLHELGVWDKVEAANFPIKLGATLLWGRTKELWSFDFVPLKEYRDEARPGQYVGQRRSTAFQVDRAIYDKILLDHAVEMGAEIHQPAGVTHVEHEGDRVTGLRLDTGETVEARYYVDASGNPAVVRRALNIETTVPTSLQNVAFWDYWRNADWAVEIGVGGTRIQVISVDYGWLWFIPLGPDRTSLGFVTSAAFYKSSKLKPEELYLQAIEDAPRIKGLLSNATSENKFTATKDWSFVAERSHGENWFLVGESAGFADPILSAGLTITHSAARELAYTINEIEAGAMNAEWLKEQFSSRQISRVRNHIRFADYWYSANGQLKELKEYTAQIAKDQGLDLDPEKAWRWLALGGFIDEDLSSGTGSFTIDFVKSMGEYLSELKFESPLLTCNTFHLRLEGAELKERAKYQNGRVKLIKCYLRSGKVFPLDGGCGLLHFILSQHTNIADITGRLMAEVEGMRKTNPALRSTILLETIRALEALTYDGWIAASYDSTGLSVDIKREYLSVHWEP
jgi:flavin-dependent dehydrogenase